ncbi:MAG: hypothetical protein L0Y58_16565 [Verrucomicrobia subdivision 3 bacterium]|nr:hypothetical protein [Limisphaerales bacterium]
MTTCAERPKCAREIQMVVRIAQPHQRGEEHTVRDLFLGAAQHFPQQQAVGEQRQVLAVLLQSGDWEHDRHILGKCGQIHETRRLCKNTRFGQNLTRGGSRPSVREDDLGPGGPRHGLFVPEQS